MAVPKKKTSKAKSRSRRALPGRSTPPPGTCPRAAGPPSVRTRCAVRAAGTRAVKPSTSADRSAGALDLSCCSIAVDAVGGDHAGRGADRRPHRGGAARHPRSPGRPRRSRRTERPATRGRIRGHRGWVTTALRGVRAQEGLVARARGRGRPRRSSVGHGERGKHRRHDGERVVADGRIRRCVAPGDRRTAARARGDTYRAVRCRRERRVPARVARAVRADGHGVPPRQRFGVASPRVGLLSIGEEASKARRSSRKCTTSSTVRLASTSSGTSKGTMWRPTWSMSSSPTGSAATSC